MKFSDLLMPSPKFATHNLSKTWRGTMSPGILYPIYHRHMVPGDKFKINLRHLIRTNPTKAPLMGRYKVRVATVVSNWKNYAIALEGYRRGFDWRSVLLPYFFWQFPDLPLGRPATDLYSGTMLPRMGVKETSLFDYLGYPRGWIPTYQQYRSNVFAEDYFNLGDNLNADALYTTKSAIPLLLYYDFYRNYMVNNQLEYFPMFTPRGFSPTDSLDDLEIGKSYVKAVKVSTLDDLIESTHKFYDGKNDYSNTEPASLLANSVNLRDMGLNPLGYLYSTVDGTSFAEGGTQILTSFDYNPLSYKASESTPYFGLTQNIFSSYHGGLCATMYDPDMNTNWMSVANFERLNEVRVNTSTVDGVTGTNFGDIVKSSALYQFVMGEVYGGGTYADHIYGQYGVSVRADINIPQVVHVLDSVIDFEDITSQSDTQLNAGTEDETGSPVGQQFGVGRSYGQSSSFTIRNIDKNFCSVMVFAWITPIVSYAQGISADHNITKLSDLYYPAFDNYSLQPLLQEQIWALPYTTYGQDYMNWTSEDNIGSDGTLSTGVAPANAVIGYQPAFTEYKSDVDSVHGLFRNQLSYWTLIRNFSPMNSAVGWFHNVSGYVYTPIQEFTPEEDALTSTIPFSVVNEDNFQVQFRFDITAIRPISKSMVPHVK